MLVAVVIIVVLTAEHSSVAGGSILYSIVRLYIAAECYTIVDVGIICTSDNHAASLVLYAFGDKM